jgi:hypothetical protein
MSVSNKYKFTIPISTDKYLNIPVEIKWDFYGQDDSIEKFQYDLVDDIIGNPKDYETERFSHNSYGTNSQTKLQYDFFFYNSISSNIPTSLTTDWVQSYNTAGIPDEDIYFKSRPFRKSFFKIDFYDSREPSTQKNYFTIILPTTNSEFTEEFIPSINLYNNIKINLPKFNLDFIGYSEGFFIYWLKDIELFNLTTFYMTAKFFDAKNGVFIKMMTVPQSTLPNNRFTFNSSDYFYYQVNLDYISKTYEIYDVISLNRVGTSTSPINWFEYVNPPA